ncbi:hypothetical protein [Salado virus]|uniref:Uncharacterized protein n=1 Tax=Salado virus TaxID=2689364 RepID=A0A6B9KGW6_9VIRU|nr:hypothetical protein QK702_s4gp1 [Salado virus]QHA33838.1 hypothetical protein [Salado virus]
MDVSKLFLDNRYSRMKDIIGEGLNFDQRSRHPNLTITDLSASNLIETKPITSAIIRPLDLSPLEMVSRQLLLGLNDDNEDASPKIGKVFQTVRSTGVSLQHAESTITLSDIETGVEKNEVCRKDEYYESIYHLGLHFFCVSPKLLHKMERFELRINYAMFGALDEEECKGLGTGQYHVDARIQLLRHTKESNGGLRSKVRWIDHQQPVTRHVNLKCQEVVSETSIKVEDVMTAMGLPRENIGITSSDLVLLRDYLQMKPSGCLTNRFLVLYLIILRMWHAKQETILIQVDQSSISCHEFTSNGLSLCLKANEDDTVVNVINMTSLEQLILARSTMGYESGDFPINGYDLYLGGYDVPKEIGNTGRVHLLGTNTAPTSANVSISLIYDTMVKYAMMMQACKEMEMGFNLAGNLFFADGLPNFSVPKPQGYVDIIASALSKVNVTGFVPPFRVNDTTMLGFLALSRQQILMVHDVLMYSESPGSDKSIPILRIPSETRQAIYAKYMRERFSDAFGICSVVDPMMIQSNRQLDVVRNMAFPSIAWSAINNDKLIRNTLSEFFWRGEWSEQSNWDCLDGKNIRRVRSTYLANGMLVDPIAKGVRVKESCLIASVAASMRVSEGPVSTRLVCLDYAPVCVKASEEAFHKVRFERINYDESEEELINPPDSEAEDEDIGDDSGSSSVLSLITDDHPVDPKITVDTLDSTIVGRELNTLLYELSKPLVKAQSCRINVRYSSTKTGVKPSYAQTCKNGFGNYLNKKRCHEVSTMKKITHLLCRISPDDVGVTCALRTDLGLMGFNKNETRKWQLAVHMLSGYLLNLEQESVISLKERLKYAAMCRIVSKYGRCRGVYNLTSIPAFNPTHAAYAAWIKYMNFFGFIINYDGVDIMSAGVLSGSGKLKPVLQELVDLSYYLNCRYMEMIVRGWGVDASEADSAPQMTHAEAKEITEIFDSPCTICFN